VTASAGTLTLTEFLTARLDEESQHADYLASIWPRDREDMTLLHWHTVSPAQWRAEIAAKRAILADHAPTDETGWDTVYCDSFNSRCGMTWRRCSGHSQPPVPACRQCITSVQEWRISPMYDEAARIVSPCDTVRALASVYASHPDYRSEWAL